MKLPGCCCRPDSELKQQATGEQTMSDAGKDGDELEDLSPREDESAALQGGENPSPPPPPPDKHPDGLPRLPMPREQ
jgi:hypothetical protein